MISKLNPRSRLSINNARTKKAWRGWGTRSPNVRVNASVPKSGVDTVHICVPRRAVLLHDGTGLGLVQVMLPSPSVLPKGHLGQLRVGLTLVHMCHGQSALSLGVIEIVLDFRQMKDGGAMTHDLGQQKEFEHRLGPPARCPFTVSCLGGGFPY